MSDNEKTEIQNIISDAFKEDRYPEDAVNFVGTTVLPENKAGVMEKINHLRLNCIKQVPILSSDRVLVLGCDGDIVAEYLKRNAAEVVFCCDVSQIDSKKESISKVISLGTLPQLAAGNYEQAVNSLYKCLAPGGIMLLAMPNPLGLKYFAGHREDYTNGYFVGIEGYKDYQVKLPKKKEMQKILEQVGFDDVDLFYPFPSYKYATSVYSDEHLPKSGELADYFEGSEMQHLVLFDETAAWNEIIDEGLFSEFANSFVFVCRKAGENAVDKGSEKVVYTRYSNDRDISKGIRTIITQSPEKVQHVYKAADSEKSNSHIGNIERAFTELTKLYTCEKTDNLPEITLNEYTNATHKALADILGQKEVIELAYAKGRTLEEELDELIDQGKKQEAEELLIKLAQVIKGVDNTVPFKMTDEFKEVFANYADSAVDFSALEGKKAVPVGDIDMIPGNIIVDQASSQETRPLNKDGQKWLLLDYEWTFFFPLPLDFIVYRSIHYYRETNVIRRQNIDEGIFEKLNISKGDIAIYETMESGFQKYVVGGHKPLAIVSKEMIFKPSLNIANVVRHMESHLMRQFYVLRFDCGEGITDDGMHWVENENVTPDLTFEENFSAKKNVRAIKFNLWNYDRELIEINTLAFRLQNGELADALPYMHTQAVKLGEKIYYFYFPQPNLIFENIPKDVVGLVADIHIVEVSDTMDMALMRKFSVKENAKQKVKSLMGKNK